MSGYVPLGWSTHRTSLEYVAHIAAQLGRLDLSANAMPPAIRTVWTELLGIPGQPSRAFDSEGVNVDRTYTKGRKPETAIVFKITTHGNLSVNWQPMASRPDPGDWKGYPEISGYGPHRPDSELFFLRGAADVVHMLKPDEWSDKRWNLGQRGLSYLAGDMLGAIRCAVYESLKPYESFVALRYLNDIVLQTEPVTFGDKDDSTNVVIQASITTPNPDAR